MTNIAWIDLETTGLDPHDSQDRILEVACVVTDGDLDDYGDPGYHAVISYSKEGAEHMRENANWHVQNMHDATGLWDRLSSPDSKPLRVVRTELLAYLRGFGNPHEMPIGGNSPRLDANFLDVWMEPVSDFLSHRLVDVSSVAQLVRNWYPDIADQLVKTSDHTAMHDIRESIREMKFYRETVFRTKDESTIWRKGADFHTRALIAEGKFKSAITMLRDRAELEAPNAKAALLFMADTIEGLA